MPHWLAIVTLCLIHQWACPAWALESSELFPVKPSQSSSSSSGLPVLIKGEAGNAAGSKVIFIPPRAYLLCWKGVCDPRLWAEMAKRTPYYNFGLGKRSGDLSMEEEEGESGELETGKRGGGTSGSRYNFGIGKKDDENRRFNFGLGKRDQRYAFGLGKREAEEEQLSDYEPEEEEATDVTSGKRQMYSFGLGKRSSPYSFGLGKRDQRYAFGLGKREALRDAAYRYAVEGNKRNKNLYSFGLGKRSRMAYNFGLGKRRPEEEEDEEREAEPEAEEQPETEESEHGKRSSPYSFGLGKRSADWKRNRYAFGLGKREAGLDPGPGPAPSEPQANQHQQKADEANVRTTSSPAKDLLH